MYTVFNHSIKKVKNYLDQSPTCLCPGSLYFAFHLVRADPTDRIRSNSRQPIWRYYATQLQYLVYKSICVMRSGENTSGILASIWLHLLPFPQHQPILSRGEIFDSAIVACPVSPNLTQRNWYVRFWYYKKQYLLNWYVIDCNKNMVWWDQNFHTNLSRRTTKINILRDIVCYLW